jgi:hypothetical protein
MNNLCYLLLLSGVLGKRDIDPTLLCLLFAAPGMGMGGTMGAFGAGCPTAPAMPLPVPPPPPTTPTTTAQTGAWMGTQPLDPLLMCLLFSGSLFGEGRRRHFPKPFFQSEPLERKAKDKD